MTLAAGDKVPGFRIKFEALVAQPPIDQLKRTIQLRVYRTEAPDVDSYRDEHSAESINPRREYKSPPLLPTVPDTAVVSTGRSSASDSGPVIVRREDFDVPPVPGSRLSQHEIEIGNIDSAGTFVVNLQFAASRLMTSRTVPLLTPNVEQPKLFWFAVGPGKAVAKSSKVWLLAGDMPVGDVGESDAGMQRAVLSPANVPRGKVKMTSSSRDEPVKVAAGEPVVIRVLTRDQYVNTTCRGAHQRVTAELLLKEGTDKDRELPKAPPNSVAQRAPDGDWIEREPTRPTRNLRALASYKGEGYHEATFVRDLAGKYLASATLDGGLITPGNPQRNALVLQVTHAECHPPTCTCRTLQQSAVDPRAIRAALERERMRRYRESRQAGAIAVGHPQTLDDPPSCWPEGSDGIMEVLALDRFENRCNLKEVKVSATLLAQESWAVELEPDLPEHVAPPEPPAPPPNGKAWVEYRGNALYQVHFRGPAGRYLLNIADVNGTHFAASPYPVLIVPPAGGPASARLHGAGARRAVSEEWSHFLLRPSEFMGCEPGPCRESRELFADLHVSLEPANLPLPVSSPPSAFNSERGAPARDGSPARRGVTMPQPEPAKNRGYYSNVDTSPPKQTSRRAPPPVMIETHFGEEQSKRQSSPRRRRAAAQGGGLAQAPEVAAIEPGAHLVRFKVKQAGEYFLHVRYGGVALSGSPFTLKVLPSLLKVDQCMIYGLCEQEGEVQAGTEISGGVLLADRHGNPVIPGPQVFGVPIKLAVEPIGPTLDPYGVQEQGMPHKIEMKADAGEVQYEPPGEIGTIPRVGARFAFTLCVAGWYRITASADGKQLPLPYGCFPLLVTPQKSDATVSIIEDPMNAGELVPAGDRFSLLAIVRDKHGNVCARGGHEVRAHLRSPAILAEPFTTVKAIPYAEGYLPARGMVLCDRRDGSYEFKFTPSILGAHELTLTMYDGPDTAILGGRSMQFNVIPGQPSPEHCVVKGHGSRVAWAGVPAEFVLEARDAAGHLVRNHPLQLRVSILPASQPQQLSVTHDGEGRYVVRYQLPLSGLYKISVQVGLEGSPLPQYRRHVPGSPFEVAVHSGEKHDSGFSDSSLAQSYGMPSASLIRSIAGDRFASERNRGRSASPSPRARTPVNISDHLMDPYAAAMNMTPRAASAKSRDQQQGAPQQIDVLVADSAHHLTTKRPSQAFRTPVQFNQ